MGVDVRMVSCAELPVVDPDTPIVAAQLAAAGFGVEVADWRDPAVDWSGARLTLLRSPWDYIDHYEEFVAWIGRTGTATDLWNPPELLTWNVHKSYLLDLASQGAPVVPTVLLLHGSAASLDGMCDAQGWNTVVVKPAVGIGGAGAGRFDVGDAIGQAHLDGLLAHGDVLVQPFVPTVASEGERSVVVIDGVVTHAVAKIPAAGEYRVHEEWGGTVELVDATDGQRDLARRVVAALPVAPMYARIDMLRGHDGWMVLEVEATEPSLWLDLAPPAAAARLVAAISTRLEG